MGTAAQERNRAFVLKAFDTLASRRDDAAAQRFWSADCSQRSTTSRAGRDGLSNLAGVQERLPMIGDTSPTEA